MRQRCAIYACFLFFLVSSFSFAQQAQNRRALVFGGNCEDPSGTNNFNAPMTLMAGALHARGWQIEPFFDGDRARCTNCTTDGDPATWNVDALARASGRSPSDVRRASRQELYDALDRLASDRSIGPHSQVLLSFHTHGNTNEGHLDLCLSDGSRLRSDDPELLRKIKAVRARGAQIGFAVSACHSAAAVEDFKPLGCVLTSGLVHQSVWIDSFENLFVQALLAPPDQRQALDLDGDNRINMEEMFLHQLVNSHNSGQPQLSAMPETIEAEAATLSTFPIELTRSNSPQSCLRQAPIGSYEDLASSSYSAAIALQLQQMMAAFQDSRTRNNSSMAIPSLPEIQRLRQQLTLHAHKYATLVRNEHALRNDMEAHHLQVPVTFSPSPEFNPWNDLLSEAARERVTLPVSYLSPYQHQYPAPMLLAYHLLSAAFLRIQDPATSAAFRADMPRLERLLANQIPTLSPAALLQLQNSDSAATATRLAGGMSRVQTEQSAAWNRFSENAERLDRLSRNLRFAAYLRNRRAPGMSQSTPITDCARFSLD